MMQQLRVDDRVRRERLVVRLRKPVASQVADNDAQQHGEQRRREPVRDVRTAAKELVRGLPEEVLREESGSRGAC